MVTAGRPFYEKGICDFWSSFTRGIIKCGKSRLEYTYSIKRKRTSIMLRSSSTGGGGRLSHFPRNKDSLECDRNVMQCVPCQCEGVIDSHGNVT